VTGTNTVIQVEPFNWEKWKKEKAKEDSKK